MWQQERSPQYAFALSVLQQPSTRALLADPAFLALLQPETFQQLAEVCNRRHLPSLSFLDYLFTEPIVVACLRLLSAHTLALANIARSAFSELVAPLLCGSTTQEAKTGPFVADMTLTPQRALQLLQSMKGGSLSQEQKENAKVLTTWGHFGIVWVSFVTLYCKEASTADKWKVLCDVELYRSVCAGQEKKQQRREMKRREREKRG